MIRAIKDIVAYLRDRDPLADFDLVSLSETPILEVYDAKP